MSIKRSYLEQKWYYRVAKVIFLWLPPIGIAIILFLVIFSDMIGKSAEDLGVIVQSNGSLIVGAVIGLLIYFLILKGIWRGFLYIAFGGLENDVDKKAGEIARPATISNVPITSAPVTSALTPSDKNQIVGWILMLITIGSIYYAYFIYKPQNIVPGPGPTNQPVPTNTTCIPTGCGSQWYCSGTYYVGGSQKRVNGCVSTRLGEIYSSWSGTCRRCP